MGTGKSVVIINLMAESSGATMDHENDLALGVDPHLARRKLVVDLVHDLVANKSNSPENAKP